jgi:hypothetical protein
MLFDGMICGQSDVIEQTESHRFMNKSMMTWRTNQTKRLSIGTFHHGIDSGKTRTGRPACDFVRLGRHERIAFNPPTSVRRILLDATDIHASVDFRKLIHRSDARLGHLTFLYQSGSLQFVTDRDQPRRTLPMCSRFVIEESVVRV